jgi:hypothetical protein
MSNTPEKQNEKQHRFRVTCLGHATEGRLYTSDTPKQPTGAFSRTD